MNSFPSELSFWIYSNAGALKYSNAAPKQNKFMLVWPQNLNP